jgi:aerobic C4-dicarboxylate transport protein
MTTFALIVGVIVALIIQPGHGVDTGIIKGGDISKYTQTGFSWLRFLRDNSTLQVLIIALILGVSLNYYQKKKPVIDFLHLVGKWVFYALSR